MRRGMLLALLALALGAVLWRLVAFGALTVFQTEDYGDQSLVTVPFASDRPVHITLLGTSLTARGTHWVQDLRTQLSACRTSGVEIARRAKPGATSSWAKKSISEALRGTDILVMEFTINDASLARGMSLARAASLLDELLAVARDADVPVLLATMSPALGGEALERPGQAAYRHLYRDRARAGAAALLDTIPLWRGLAPEVRRSLVPDGLHPTDVAMSEIYVPALVNALSPIICDRRKEASSAAAIRGEATYHHLG